MRVPRILIYAAAIAGLVFMGGLSLEDLEKKGQQPLNTEEIKTLLVGKTTYMTFPHPRNAWQTVDVAQYFLSDQVRLFKNLSISSPPVIETNYSIKDNQFCYEAVNDLNTYCGKYFKTDSGYVVCLQQFKGTCFPIKKIADGDSEKMKAH